MFKKLVSNLPFSPTLVGQLGFYANRLKKEEATRRIGLILTALALLLQSFVVFSPPESANAASASDLVYGGIHTKTQLLAAWDKNTQGYRDLLKHAGLTRANLVKAKEGHINSRTNGKGNGWLTWGRVAKGGAKFRESSFKVGNQTIYARSLAAYDTGSSTKGNGSYFSAFIMTNSKGQQVVVTKACANIVMKTRPKSDANIKVCNLATKKIITIRQSQFNKNKHSKDTKNCQAKSIKVCDLTTKKIITIKDINYDSKKHSKNLDNCKEKTIKVCDIANKKIITIKEKDFNSRKHSKNFEDCKEKPVPVANCSSLVIKKISRTEFDLQGAANTANGAAIQSYTYVIKDESGKEVTKRTVNTTSKTNSIRVTVGDEGKYSVVLTVATSLGNKTATACQGELIVEPIERCPLNPELPINDPDCQPCPGDPTLWVKDEDCAAKISREKKATNLTASKPAEEVVAKASDRIQFVLTAKNDGKDTATFVMEDDISDVLEYSTLYDRGSGTLDEQTKTLSWGEVTLKPGEEQERIYVVQMANKISPMSQGSSDPASYDCRMINIFGNTVEIAVDCPAPKIIEQQIVPELPRTGATENMIAGGIVAAVVAFLYMRSRQLNKEVRLIRREVTAGTI